MSYVALIAMVAFHGLGTHDTAPPSTWIAPTSVLTLWTVAWAGRRPGRVLSAAAPWPTLLAVGAFAFGLADDPDMPRLVACAAVAHAVAFVAAHVQRR